MIEETRNSIARLRENEKEILVQRYALKTGQKTDLQKLSVKKWGYRRKLFDKQNCVL